MPQVDIENFDPSRIPDTNEETTFHSDATYVFNHLANEIIPGFNQNLDWIADALSGDTQTILDSLDEVLGAHALKIGAREVHWGTAGQHRLTDNDGDGHANIRFGHYHNNGARVSSAGGSGVHLRATVDNPFSSFEIHLLGSGAAAGDEITSVAALVLSENGTFTWDGEDIWHSGNLDPSLYLRSDTSVKSEITFEEDIWIGKNTGGDTNIRFYDDSSNEWRSLRWDDSANAFTVEDNSGSHHKILHEGNADFVTSGGTSYARAEVRFTNERWHDVVTFGDQVANSNECMTGVDLVGGGVDRIRYSDLQIKRGDGVWVNAT